MRKLNVTDGQTDGRAGGQTGALQYLPPTAPVRDNKNISDYYIDIRVIFFHHQYKGLYKIWKQSMEDLFSYYIT